MAPELFQRPIHVSFKIDIWSLGVIFYRIATNKNPFLNKNITKNNIFSFYKELSAQGEPKINFPISIDPVLKHLIIKMLKFNISKRYSIEEVLKHPYFTGNYI